MASGRTHTIVNLSAISVSIPLLHLYSSFSLDDLLVGAGSAFFGTIFLSPDLDLKQSRSSQAWGWFSWIWYAYNRCFSHRKLSHFFIIGTISRVLYLFLATVFFGSIASLLIYCYQEFSVENVLIAQESVGQIIRDSVLWAEGHPQMLLAGFIGLVFSDSLHLVTDLIYSFFKRRSA
ncbi:MAG: metal-binding protein [Oligoflexales bacterium]|nr:metal-binding protein [Oligoflexales bacterium]